MVDKDCDTGLSTSIDFESIFVLHFIALKCIIITQVTIKSAPRSQANYEAKNQIDILQVTNRSGKKKYSKRLREPMERERSI